MTTIRCPLSEAAQISPHEPAIISDERIIRYYELDELASRVAGHLTDFGLVAGERVALYLPADWRSIALYLGVIRAGATACFINTRLPRAAVLSQIHQLGCQQVISYLQDPAAPDLAGLRVHHPSVLLAPREQATGERSWKVQLDQPATIVFTSGSTGEPKPAVLSYGNHYYSARGSNLNIRLASHDRWLMTLPLYHVGGLGVVFRCLLSGATMVIPEPGQTLEYSQGFYAITHLSMVPTQLIRLLRLPEMPASFGQVKAIVLGGGPIPASALVEALRRGWPVLSSYGLTEMASQVCTVSPLAPPAQRMNAGAPLRYRQVRISPEGEIEVRGETLFMGYLEQGAVVPHRTAEGWYATGDLGELDAQGQLTVKGRRDFMFISGGENIQPEEIERALGQIPEVEEAVVVPVTDAEFGERPVAFVRYRGAVPGDDKLRRRLGELLPKYKIPKAFLPWPEDGDPARKPDRIKLMLEAQLKML
jgi:O-succinylbenzoic acid--CoA ligase